MNKPIDGVDYCEEHTWNVTEPPKTNPEDQVDKSERREISRRELELAIWSVYPDTRHTTIDRIALKLGYGS